MASRTAVLLALVAPALLPASGCGEPAPPNVLLFSLDSVRWDHAGVRLGGTATTPAIDRLGAEGVVFEQAVSTTSWTLPSHIALMSGLPDALHGVSRHDVSLDPALVTLAELLGDERATGAFVSGPYLNPVFGFGQGFDVYENAGATVPLEVFDSDDSGRWVDVHVHSHETVTSPRLFERAGEWIRETVGRGESFFAFVHWWDPHYDYKTPPEYAALFETGYEGSWTGVRARDIDKWDPDWKYPDAADLAHLLALYAAEIRFTDDHIGRLLGLLDELDVADDTLVVVTADHGEEFFENPEHPRWGHQRTLRDDVLRVPLVLRFPGRVPAGVRASGQAGLPDVLPTIADLVDLPVPPYVYGHSLRPLWEDPEHPGFDQPLLLVVPHRSIRVSGLRTPEMKVLWDHTAEEGSYWHLRRDPAERRKGTFDRAELETSDHPVLSRLRAWLDEADGRRAALPSARAADGIELDEATLRELEALGYAASRTPPPPPGDGD